jgi:hypothetical protein
VEAPASAAPEPAAATGAPADAWEHVGEERTQGSFFSRLKKSFGFD